MSLYRWSDRNDLLNSLGSAILDGTFGLVCDLAIDHHEDDYAVVRGRSRSYYGVQLAIHSTKLFGDKQRFLTATRLILDVRGSSIDLTVSHHAKAESPNTLSTHRVNCTPQLTASASK